MPLVLKSCRPRYKLPTGALGPVAPPGPVGPAGPPNGPVGPIGPAGAWNSTTTSTATSPDPLGTASWTSMSSPGANSVAGPDRATGADVTPCAGTTTVPTSVPPFFSRLTTAGPN